MHRLKEARLALGLTQEKFSELLGVPQNGYSNWERRARAKVPPTVILDAADLVNWEPGYVLGKPGVPKERKDHASPRWQRVVDKAVAMGITPEVLEEHLDFLARVQGKAPGRGTSSDGGSPGPGAHAPG